MLTFLLIVRLSHLRPNALLQRKWITSCISWISVISLGSFLSITCVTHDQSGIDKLIEPLRTTIQSKAKANSVKQEFEKQDELKRSAMRAIAALLTIPDSGEIA